MTDLSILEEWEGANWGRAGGTKRCWSQGRIALMWSWKHFQIQLESRETRKRPASELCRATGAQACQIQVGGLG